MPDTYPRPAHGWTCFHCGETFPGDHFGWRRARDHFGYDVLDDAACRLKAEEEGLLQKLRRAQVELRRYYAEDSDKDREFHAMRADHEAALRRAEELGYERGLRDAAKVQTDG